ncbi:hypothetical protein BGW36DRAFT_380695 [Talaromyces proteolyticus]|uniref:N-acetylgalactosaminide beta-1,3-galactosyltransferase n=1 Tax=Talaromyces proteolyticus TaxID=1131652 RepID=A0AAD4KTM5_9EURO|nr:uncharacterized protein BGW36DRAFT_380695 [Talaromyces proteolyticus]KAH8696326.1 hypothetical protein BGW36DRAFT_380695 [Talaromyces proteolyticus]
MQQPSIRRYGHSRRRIWILLVAPAIGLMLLWSWLQGPYSIFLEQILAANARSVNDAEYKNGMSELAVILKTGVTEPLQKVAVHIETTLSDVPFYAVFSDYQETIAGVPTYDVLRNVSDRVKQHIPDFDLYNRIQQRGRQVLAGPDHGDDSSGPFGRQNNPGWRLDKWKFLPMISLALDLRPDAKWFVFIEADSYIVWPSLVNLLSRLDAREDLYLGSPMQIGTTVFAYGGAGFVLSNSAMRKVSKHRTENEQRVDDFTAMHWAGDCVLGKVLLDVGVALHSSWPMLQPDTPWELDFVREKSNRRTWCYPLISYHHMTADDVREMWRFDRWFNRYDTSARPLLYRDVFRHFVLPEILSQRGGWDSLAEDAGNHSHFTLDGCARRCSDDTQCLQYAYHVNGSCFTSRGVRRGVPRGGVESGWMVDRILEKMREYELGC